MFISNIPVILRMYTDLKNLKFSLRIIRRLKQDVHYSLSKYIKMLFGASQGERIVRFNDYYIISSYIPPVPSQAFLTFLDGCLENPCADLAWVRRSAPLSTHIAITDQCDYDCVHCSARLDSTGPELNTAQWIEVISRLQDLGVAYIGFTGGEPLLRDDIEEIIMSVDDRSVTILFTNGKKLTPERAQLLKSTGLFALSVSLDSADSRTHNYIRSDPDAFSSALQAIYNARRAGLYTIVQAVVYRKELSWSKLFRLFRLVKKHGAHEIRVHQPVPAGRLLSSKNNDIFYTNEDREKLFAIQFAANRKLWGLPKVSSFPYTEGPDKFGCSAGVLHSYITAQGEFCPCDFIPLSFGNVLQISLEQLYAKMNQAVGIPRLNCWAMQMAKELRHKRLPLGENESKKLCSIARSDKYPKFYRALQ